jgi:hypothetical protein
VTRDIHGMIAMTDKTKPWQRRRCLNDGMVISMAGIHCEGTDPVIRFYWCRYCKELFAFAGDNEFGGRYAGSFVQDVSLGGWRLLKSGDLEGDVQLAIAAIRQVGLVPSNAVPPSDLP